MKMLAEVVCGGVGVFPASVSSCSCHCCFLCWHSRCNLWGCLHSFSWLCSRSWHHRSYRRSSRQLIEFLLPITISVKSQLAGQQTSRGYDLLKPPTHWILVAHHHFTQKSVSGTTNRSSRGYDLLKPPTHWILVAHHHFNQKPVSRTTNRSSRGYDLRWRLRVRLAGACA